MFRKRRKGRERALGVLFVLPGVYFAGAEHLSVSLILELRRLGTKADLFTFRRQNGDLPFVEGDSLRPIVGSTGWGRLGQSRPLILARLVWAARKYDVIVGALERDPTLMALVAGRLLRRPVIGQVHTDMTLHASLEPLGVRESIMHQVYRRLDLVVGVSQDAARSAIELGAA